MPEIAVFILITSLKWVSLKKKLVDTQNPQIQQEKIISI
jgi:hypothetical protein